MIAGSLDTLTIARRLQAAGFSEGQAEAVTGILHDVRESDFSTLVTKDGLRNEIVAVKNELRTEIANMKFEILKRVLSAIGFQTIVLVGAVVALTRGTR